MSKQTTATKHIREQDGDFLLHPSNNDLFAQTGKQIIEACKLSISVGVWLDELNRMLAEVKQWCGGRSDKIAACLAEGRGSEVLLFFVPHGLQFNFDLADELADLNRSLVTNFNIGMVEVGQIPAAEIRRFMDMEKVRIVYGRVPETSETVET
jgi:hypothetical protein